MGAASPFSNLSFRLDLASSYRARGSCSFPSFFFFQVLQSTFNINIDRRGVRVRLCMRLPHYIYFNLSIHCAAVEFERGYHLLTPPPSLFSTPYTAGALALPSLPKAICRRLLDT